MKSIKILTVTSILLFGLTTSAFASWWNPFTWFHKKVVSVQQVKQNSALITENTSTQIASSTDKEIKNDLLTYVNSNFGYSIGYPLNWTPDSEKRIMDETNKIESLIKISDISLEHGIIITVNQNEYPLLSEASITEKVVINGILETAYIFPEGYECRMRNPAKKDCSFFIIPIHHNGLWYEIKITGEAKNISEFHKKILSTFKFTNIKSSSSLYVDEKYGFSIDFPKDDPAKTTNYGSLHPFDSEPVVYSVNWITVNVSDKQADINDCVVPGKIHNNIGYANKLDKTYRKNINGVNFEVSDWNSGDSYERNYTTLHNDKCFDIQIITVPSCSLCNNGRPPLESYKPKLNEMDKIVQSFKFIKLPN